MQVKVWLPKEKGKFNTEDDSNIKTYWLSSLTTIEKISCMKQFDSNITRLKKMVLKKREYCLKCLFTRLIPENA